MTILIPQYRTARRASAVGLDLLSNLILSLDLEEASGNAIDSSGSGYDFTDTNTVGQTTGQTAGYNSREFVSANTEYFSRAASTTELSIGNNEWACHLWVYNSSSSNSTTIFMNSDSTGGLGTSSNRMFRLVQSSSTNRNLLFEAGLTPASSGSVSVVTPNNQFPISTWTSILLWHDPIADVIGIKAGSNAAVTASITTGVRTSATIPVRIGATSTGTTNFNGRVAALRIWRGSGVIAQIVDNTDALAFLNGQQRRHSELT